ncbi:hypothetical protein PIB30_016580 [Stylosanthes scabra]|uniref:TF-B3 domain-containing protein n=1 Tax=Stylosanthes scabra TaxID=79078 RepID=A0ABU6T7N4_9FABA|nr:hypothetical protein [Stylosanthes scabra]
MARIANRGDPNKHTTDGIEESSDTGAEIIGKQEFLAAVRKTRSTRIKKGKKKRTKKVPNTRYLGWGNFEVRLNTPTLCSDRLYLPRDFARDIKKIGGSRKWIVVGPKNNIKTHFQFKLIKSKNHGKEYKLGLGWENFGDVYELEEDDICTFQIASAKNHLITASLR